MSNAEGAPSRSRRKSPASRMQILLYEYASGGGLAGEPVPPSLGREGSAMRDALAADLARGNHRVLLPVDSRFPSRSRAGIETVEVEGPDPAGARLDRWIASSNAVWLIAPETGRCLERLAARVEAHGVALAGSGARAIARAADKGALASRFVRRGIPMPETRLVRRTTPSASLRSAALAVGYPVIVKPRYGAGSQGVVRVSNPAMLEAAVEAAGAINARATVILQQYIRGTAASVSVLANGSEACVLAVNGQAVSRARGFAYQGGVTPLEHSQVERATAMALAALQVLPGLRGYIGVDMVLSREGPVVIEVNPRLTTSYLGIRRSIRENVAQLGLAAALDGDLPPAVRQQRRVRFDAVGRILETTPLDPGRIAG